MKKENLFLTDKQRLRHDEVIELLHNRIPKLAVKECESVKVDETVGRVMAKEVVAKHNVPKHNNAAVDGYAFNYKDLKNEKLSVSLTISAGDLELHTLKSGTVARILTGAVLPKGADTIAMEEECVIEKNNVGLPKDINKGANCRKAGEDVKEKEIVVTQSQRIKPADVAAMVSVGENEIQVYRKLKVLVLSSGNELRNVMEAKTSLQVGEVWDTNAPMIKSLARNLPIEIEVGEILPDDLGEVRERLKKYSGIYDMIVTTGGASYGDEDYMMAALKELGTCHLWQLAVKPGRPMMLGQIGQCVFVGLPGNPVASMVCFMLYVREAILLMGGTIPTPVPRYKLPIMFEVKNKKVDRREFRRGILVENENGEYALEQFHSTGSGLISSLRKSDGLIEIEEGVKEVKKGEYLNFIPYNSFD